MQVIDTVTKADLEDFRQQLLHDLIQAMEGRKEMSTRRFIKTAEARALLGVSSNTLISMVINHQLHRSRLGGIWYYDVNEITTVLSQRK